MENGMAYPFFQRNLNVHISFPFRYSLPLLSDTCKYYKPILGVMYDMNFFQNHFDGFFSTMETDLADLCPIHDS